MKKILFILVFISTLYISLPMNVNAKIKKITANYESNLPVVYINTENSAAISSKDVYLDATMLISPNDTYTDPDMLYNGPIKIKGRGNSSWSFPKKPYKIKLDKSTDLFGFGKSKDWILLANYLDESLMRNKVAYDLSGAMGLPYMQSTWVDVVLNGKYVGNYLLCEQVKIAKDRVDIFSWEDTAEDIAKAIYDKERKKDFTKYDYNSLKDKMTNELKWITGGKVSYKGTEYNINDYYKYNTDISGGYLIEVSNEYDEFSKFKTPDEVPVMIKEPEYLRTNDEMYQYIKKYVISFEEALYARDGYGEFNDKKVSYVELADIHSMVDNWLIAKIFANNDASYKSRFLYKDTDDIIRFGPVWDYDFSSGSSNPWTRIGYNSPLKETYINFWNSAFPSDPYFMVKAVERYSEIRNDLLEDLIKENGIIDSNIDYLKVSGKNNSKLWYYKRGFSDDSKVFKNWMVNRLKFLDSEFSDVKTLLKGFGNYTPDSKIKISISDSKKNKYIDGGEIPFNKDIILDITAKDNTFTEMRVYVNGIYAGDAYNDKGQGKIKIDASYFNEKIGRKNVINVWLKDSDDFIASNFVTLIEKEKETPRFIAILQDFFKKLFK